jgi:gluconate 2-dehydrogenase alpha chain
MPPTRPVLTQRHSAVLDALVARLIPTDEHGPGAREAGVPDYIVRSLGAEYGEHLETYAGGLAAIDALAEARGAGFAELAAADQDAVLLDVERGAGGVAPATTAFFGLVRSHVLEGMFGDPVWGGNAGHAGWRLLGYPGPRLEWTEAEQQLDVAVPLDYSESIPGGSAVTRRSGPPPARRADAAADVVIVGLGGAGGIAAHVLTEAGLEVTALEAGPRVDASMMRHDEIRNDVREWLASAKYVHEVPTWRTSPDEEAGDSPWPMLMVNAVGGSTVHFPGLSPRFHPWNFEMHRRTVERYGEDAIPADSTLVDWPFSYDALEPHYAHVEHAVGVAGAAGSPFEGTRSRAYPMPPLRRTGWTELMAGAARELGWNPYPAPASINSEPYNGNPECTYCGFCMSNGCYRNAKGALDTTVIPRAEATGRLRIETGARVVRIEVDGDGRTTGVTYVKDGREQFAAARAVLLGAFTYENIRLLLLSDSKAYPHGLSNNHGRVGRDFMCHVTPFVFGLFPGRRLNVYNGLVAQATAIDDWNADNFDHADMDFLGGALMLAHHEFKPITIGSRATPPSVPGWGAEWKAWLREHGQSVGGVNAQLESLPYEGNYVDLDPVARDPHGVPKMRVTYSVREHERRGYEFMVGKLREWLRAAGATETWTPEDVFVEARHCYGGTRMGDDPETSVVDGYGFSHEAPNLGVIGASVFPSTGGCNPTLTLQAVTWRTAQHLVDEWGAIAGG